MHMAKFCERLKELRREYALTQEELSRKLNMSRSSLAMYEQGQRDPNTETLEAMADFFNVDMDYLMGRTHSKHGANFEYYQMDLESIIYLNKLSRDQMKQLLAVAKAMFPEVR